ncbi:MAG: phosphotransferase family protein [Pseudomonadota bacterium]
MHSEAEKLLPWFRSTLQWGEPRFDGPMTGGNSNLTWRFSSGEKSCVVRTFPAATISPTAHRGIEREHTVLKAIQGQVRAPQILGWSDGEKTLGRPFLAVECIDGVSITDTLPEAYARDPSAASMLGEELIDQLAAIHSVDLEASKLIRIGRPEKFLERQVVRWLKIRSESKVRELPAIEALGRWLLANEPPKAPPALVHGDYHLDNTLASRFAPEILAVIDWEMATVGDPYTDLGLALMFWGETRTAKPPAFAHLQAISRMAGVVGRQTLAERWATKTGRGLEHLDYYLAYAFWRLAAIVEGAYCLYVEGKVDSDYARDLEFNVPALLAEAEQASRGNW